MPFPCLLICLGWVLLTVVWYHVLPPALTCQASVATSFTFITTVFASGFCLVPATTTTTLLHHPGRNLTAQHLTLRFRPSDLSHNGDGSKVETILSSQGVTARMRERGSCCMTNTWWLSARTSLVTEHFLSAGALEKGREKWGNVQSLFIKSCPFCLQ